MSIQQAVRRVAAISYMADSMSSRNLVAAMIFLLWFACIERIE